MKVPPVLPELEAMAALREPNRRRLYQYVERQPHAVSRDEAAEKVGISRALAAFHLDKLVGLGLLKAEYRRLSGRSGPGAGRTSKLYRRSRQQFAMSLPHRNLELLARLLAASSDSGARIPPDAEPAREYGRSLGHRARTRMRGDPEPARLLECVEAVLESLGFEPYRASPTEVRLRNCPFDPLSRLYTPLVCGVGQAMISGIVQGVGADPLRVGRDERSDRCCGIVRLPSQKDAAAGG
ncbi:MAG: transcriptional regulator [Chloroflexota bacterium]|nr:transcriptional regulator [Chloroflexota bacterium]